MTTLVELNKLMRDVVNNTVSIGRVIVANQNGQRPDTNFCTVYVAEMSRIGIADIEYENSGQDLSEKVVRTYEARISFNFYRENARMNAAIFASSFEVNSVLEMMNAASVGFTRASPVRDLAQVFNASHEERAQLDIFVSFELTSGVEIVTSIETVRIQGDFENSSQVIETVDITVP